MARHDSWCAHIVIASRWLFGINPITEIIAGILTWSSGLQYEELACCRAFAKSEEAQGSHRCQQIRVLRVLTSDSRIGVRCELTTVAEFTNVDTPYYCLSYAWSDPNGPDLWYDQTRSIWQNILEVLGMRETLRGIWQQTRRLLVPRAYTVICNGMLLRVSPNLWDALMCLSRSGRPELNAIWIDAISINQRSNAEKSSQVPSMQEIYSHAQSVVLWLGAANRGEMEHVRRGIENLRLVESRYQSLEQALINDEHRRDVMAMYDFETLWEVQKILHRSYWKRLWIFQEVVSAANIIVACGEHTMAWCDICGLSEIMTSFGRMMLVASTRHGRTGASDLGMPDLFDTWRRRFQDDPENRLRGWFGSMVLSLNRNMFYCKDPRDRIYALIGVCNRHKDVPVAYEKPVSQVYTEFWAEILGRPNFRGCLNLLECVEDQSQSSLRGKKEMWKEKVGGNWMDLGLRSLPSWVPDLHTPLNPTSLPQHYGEALFQALVDGLGQPISVDGLAKGRLLVEGYHVDTIIAISETDDDLTKNSTIDDLLSLLERSLNSAESPYHSVREQVEAFYKTMAVQVETYKDGDWPIRQDTSKMCKDWLKGVIAHGVMRKRRLTWKWAFPTLVRSTGLSSVAYNSNTAFIYEPLRRVFSALNSITATEDLQRAIPTVEEASEYSVRSAEFFDQRIAAVRRGEAVSPLSHDASENFIGLLASAFGLRALECRRLFLTKGGYIGKVGKSVAVGDEVWVIPGTRVPYVFRNHVAENAGSSVKVNSFIGHAYVHGLMGPLDQDWVSGIPLEGIVLV
ncbi:hypothetical protein GQ53DRAFT_818126 [Thozetella sp. PMI_491]|nr:hypothetical protein GQ53DRAFT_818126 [Thozetella sp. PMI_491]